MHYYNSGKSTLEEAYNIFAVIFAVFGLCLKLRLFTPLIRLLLFKRNKLHSITMGFLNHIHVHSTIVILGDTFMFINTSIKPILQSEPWFYLFRESIRPLHIELMTT